MNITKTKYLAVHRWLKSRFGEAAYCENEGNSCSGKSKRFDWALIPSKAYAFARSHFRQLCRSCHRKQDFANGQYENTRRMFVERGKRVGSELGKATRKLSMTAAQDIRQRYDAGGCTQTALAKTFGVDQAVISHIVNGHAYVHA